MTVVAVVLSSSTTSVAGAPNAPAVEGVLVGVSLDESTSKNRRLFCPRNAESSLRSASQKQVLTQTKSPKKSANCFQRIYTKRLKMTSFL